MLAFCVCVSGGCGGGSSSSDDSAPTSGDIAPTPESDDYGGSDRVDLVSLNGTKWRISTLDVIRSARDANGEASYWRLPVSKYNFNFTKFTLVTTNDSFTVMDEAGQYHNEVLTVEADDDGHTVTIPIIQAAGGFKKQQSRLYVAEMNTGNRSYSHSL